MAATTALSASVANYRGRVGRVQPGRDFVSFQTQPSRGETNLKQGPSLYRKETLLSLVKGWYVFQEAEEAAGQVALEDAA